MTLCTEHGLTQWFAGGTIVRGWTLVMQGQGEAGLVHMRQGLTAHEASGSQIALPYFLALLAEAAGRVGQVDEGLHVLAETRTTVQQRGGYWWEAELTGSPAISCWRTLPRLSTRPKPGCSALWPLPAARRRKRWSCGPP